MILAACVDDRMGMLFGGRRQSRDAAVRERLVFLSAGGRLWMNAYSARLFSGGGAGISVDPDFPERAASGELCFFEDVDPLPFEARAEKIILFKWNRAYPYDLRFSIPLSGHGWRLDSVFDFPGVSHERITEEVYIK